MNYFFKSRGLTLLELLLAITVVLVLIGLAMPSFIEIIQSHRLRQASESFYNDLLLARATAIKQQTTVFVVFQSGTNWCYGLNNNSSCSCSVTNNCQLNGTTKIITSSNFNGVTLNTSNFSGANTAFEGVRGTVSNTGTITLSNNGKSVSIIINKMGYIQICSNTFSGYNPC